MTKLAFEVSRGWGRSLIAVLVLAAAASGQDIVRGRTVYNEQIRIALDRQMPDSRETGFDAGGWMTITFFDYDDAAAHRHRTLTQYALRGWASFNHRGIHRAYIRGLMQFDDWRERDNPIGGRGRGDDFDTEIERAWYQFDLGQMMALQSGQRPPVGLRVRVGRDFDTIGTSLALSMVLDAVRVEATTQWVDVKVLVGLTPDDSYNIDPSDRIGHNQERLIFGVQATGKVGQHRPFVYFLMNDDYTDDRPRSTTQKFEYDSYYVGVGSTGSILPRLSYIAEIVGEWGDTYSNNATSGKDHICAWASDFQLAYRFPGRMRPRAFFEYLYASGDDDRSGSSIATTGGNRIGTDDNAFNAFGFRDTGVAAAPAISNLHMLMVGGSFFPFSDCSWFEQLEFGTKVFFYWKDASRGATSDTTSTNDATWLGWEIDFYCNWRITSDLAWTARYGIFDPGTAFTTNDGAHDNVRHFFYTGILFSF
ncbi:MAG: alginate export family protein [Planctomycetota bacterium]|jgi:hypothetical protein